MADSDSVRIRFCFWCQRSLSLLISSIAAKSKGNERSHAAPQCVATLGSARIVSRLVRSFVRFVYEFTVAVHHDTMECVWRVACLVQVSIGTGAYHSVAALDDGSVCTWGAGALGQLGHGQQVSTSSME
jgi:hypothetical protein